MTVMQIYPSKNSCKNSFKGPLVFHVQENWNSKRTKYLWSKNRLIHYHYSCVQNLYIRKRSMNNMEQSLTLLHQNYGRRLDPIHHSYRKQHYPFQNHFIPQHKLQKTKIFHLAPKAVHLNLPQARNAEIYLTKLFRYGRFKVLTIKNKKFFKINFKYQASLEDSWRNLNN